MLCTCFHTLLPLELVNTVVGDDLFHLAEITGGLYSIAHDQINLFPVPVRLRSDSGKRKFVVISPCFAIFKNVVHSLKPGEAPVISASHQASNYVQRS